MSNSTSSTEPLAKRRSAVVRLHGIPAWTVLGFLGVFALAYSPNVLEVSGIHNDYEMLQYKSTGFFHPESEHLFSIGRPIAALFTNIPVLPIESPADWRWIRLFSILFVSLLGAQLIWICIVRLRIRTPDALGVALGTFLVPPFIYSVLNPAAWAPHLLTIFLAFGAYTLLSRSNIQAIPFLILARRRNIRGLGRQVYSYSSARTVWVASLVYQLALYDYPPNALILFIFPVISILFSQAPRAYRTLMALRDILFVGANFVLYGVSVKLLYLPFVGQFISPIANMQTDDPFLARIFANYHFRLNGDLSEVLSRLDQLMKVAGDLWFLPQMQMHIFTGALLLLAFVMAISTALLPRRDGQSLDHQKAELARLRFHSWTSDGVVTICVVAASFVASAVMILVPAGGFVTYRTIAVPSAIAAIVFVFLTRAVTETAFIAATSSPFGAAKAGNIALALTIGAAFAANLYMNYATMKLARNEFAYFSSVVRQAIDSNSKSIFLIDQRPFSLPEDHPVVYDRQGRAVPPYELGCFSGYCLQTGAIIRVAATQLGRPDGELSIFVPRGDSPVPGLTCEMLTGSKPSYPPRASPKSIATINYYRTLVPLTCVAYSLEWHDLGADLSR